MAPLGSDGKATQLVNLTALAVALVGLVLTAEHGFDGQVAIAAAFGAFIVLGEVLRLALPNDQEIAPLSAAGGLAYALLTTYNGTNTTHGVEQVIAVFAAAAVLGSLVHLLTGRDVQLDGLARRLISVALAAALFRPLWQGGQGPVSELSPALLAVVMVGIAVFALAIDVVLAALIRADRNRAPFNASLRSEVTGLLGISAAIAATGVLIALSARVMSWWAIPVFSVPLLLTQFSYRRYGAIRKTYDDTVQALATVTEVADYTEIGHAQRVADLAVDIGGELGMSDDELRDLRRAALLHDLGQLSLPAPLRRGGATIFATAGERDVIARAGADVIRQTGVLDAVATMVERQAEPYRRPNEPVDSTVPLASRIIRVANAYDDLVGDSRERASRVDALEHLRLGMAFEYDPRVVDSLANVLEYRTRHGR